ncbi:ATP-binding protein [Streptomyces niveus]|uniref:ATP-binding protein n=1 Tax=Streptomyces niveus TaxID=193462 RepID=UPI003645513E
MVPSQALPVFRKRARSPRLKLRAHLGRCHSSAISARRTPARRPRLRAGSHRRVRLDDILLRVSELATDAVRHGVPVGGALLVKVGADEHRVRAECHDANRRRPRLRHPADDDQTGRGLLLVEAIASRWGTDERPFGKYVWFELDLKPDGTPQPPS